MKRGFQILLLMAGGALVGLLLVEGSLRLFGPEWLRWRMAATHVQNGVIRDFADDAHMPVERRNGKFLRFVPFSRFQCSHYEYNHLINIDSWGGRVTSALPPAGSSEKLKPIPFVGDSFCFGLGVVDQETYVSLLETRFQAALLNLGVPGGSLQSELDIIEARHAELGSPSIYVFNFFMGNDISDLVWRYKTSGAQKEASHQENQEWQGWPLLDWLNGFTYDHPLIRRLYTTHFLKAKILALYNHSRTNRRMDPFFLAAFKNPAFLKLADQCLNQELDRLVELSRRLGFRAVFILLPDRHQVYPQLLKLKAQAYTLPLSQIEADLPNRIVRDKLELRSIPYVDLLECMIREGRRDAKLYYVLDTHLTPAGHRAIAECATPELGRLLHRLPRQDSAR